MDRAGEDKVKKSVIRRYRRLSIIAGIMMGSVFPLFSRFFMIAKTPEAELYFSIACVFAGVVVGGISFGIGKVTLIRTISRLNQGFQHISEGDFTYESDLDSQDAIGELSDSFNDMKRSLEQLICMIADKSIIIDGVVHENVDSLGEFHNRIQDIDQYAGEVSSDMRQVSDNTSVLHTVSSEIEEAVQMMSIKAGKGSEISEGISQRAQKVKESVTSSIQSAEKIIESTSRQLEAAIENAQVIDEIGLLLTSIVQISSKTSLLALNASIEAGRAGEDGKGFAVIAKQIQELSMSTSQNIQKIGTVVEEVTAAVKDLVQGSKELLSYISENVSYEYQGFLQVVDQYSGDSSSINDIVSDFSVTSQKLSAVVMDIFQRIEGIAESADNSAAKVDLIFQQVQELSNESVVLVNETDLLNESSTSLEDAIIGFHLNDEIETPSM